MKKLLIFSALILLASCAHEVNTRTGTTVVEYTNQIGDPRGFIPESERGKIGAIKEFRYNGHDYIQFDIVSSHGGRCGIVHNPDCQCHNDSNE